MVTYSGPIRELDLRETSLLVSPLNSTVWEDAFLFPGAWKDALQSPIWECDLLSTVREMLLQLPVIEPENLQPV